MDNSEKLTFSLTLLLVVVIIASSLIIFILTPSPISPTRLLFGYITKVYTHNNTPYLDFQPAQWLVDTTSEFPASEACLKDGNCPACSLPVTQSCLPNGYYIRNIDSRISSYSIVSFAKVGTLLINPGWDTSNTQSKPYKTISLTEFQNIFQNPGTSDGWIAKAPFDITTIAGQVILINQHYIP